MGNNAVGGVGNNRGGVDDRAGDSMDNGAGDSDGVGNRDSLGVDSLAIVGDGGDVSLDVVGGVLDVLGAAVREGDGVRSSPGSSAVVSLGSLEVGAGVVVGNGVLVLVGGDLVGVHLSDGVGNGVGNSVVDNRGGVDDGGSMGNNGGSVDNRAGDGMGNRGGRGHRGCRGSMRWRSMGKGGRKGHRGDRLGRTQGRCRGLWRADPYGCWGP